MQDQLLKGLLLGLMFGSFAFFLRGYAYGAAILLAQVLFQAVNLYVFPQLRRRNLLHLIYGAFILVGMLAFIGCFYLFIKFGTLEII
jgi:asparagine N-glycosylation enzyme membrane subunit Stt3